jgi:RNA polymerase sigma-70 factor (ECF subfamily)
MVTLPELDSELGVLRFLKWKTRLLCLDVIRASGRAILSDIDAHPEFEALNADVSADIEQAEDAAIVRLALSKLNPRHREVLIASMYEEKTAAQIAAQVGLTENATNQLIFRARAAFKKALLGGDVDTTGMSTAKILSVAARKAALEAKKVGAQAMVFALFLILGVGALFSYSGRNIAQISAAPKQSPTITSAPIQEPSKSKAPLEPVSQVGGESVQIRNTSSIPIITASPSSNIELLAEAYTAASLASQQVSQISNSLFIQGDNRQVIQLSGEALNANFEFQTQNKVVSSLVLKLIVDEETYRAFPYDYKIFETVPGEYKVRGKLGYFADSQGRIVKNNPLQSADFEITLLVDSYGHAYSGQIQLQN